MYKHFGQKIDKHFGNFWRWGGGGAGGTPLAVTQEDCLVPKFSSVYAPHYCTENDKTFLGNIEETLNNSNNSRPRVFLHRT